MQNTYYKQRNTSVTVDNRGPDLEQDRRYTEKLEKNARYIRK